MSVLVWLNKMSEYNGYRGDAMVNIFSLSYAEVVDQVKARDREGLSELRISILRNIMLEPIEPYVRLLALDMGFRGVVRFGQYDNIMQEAVSGEDSVLDDRTDVVMVFTYLETLARVMARGFARMDRGAIEAEKGRINDFIHNVLAGIRKHTKGAILWHSFELPTYPARGIADRQRETSQIGTIEELNGLLKERLCETRDAFLVDMSVCLARLGMERYYDRRYWQMARAPYTLEALRLIAFEDFKFVRSLKGKTKKCLVLDCDNTLWGGVVGEDGLKGIKLGKTHPGSAYYEFQEEILNLKERGVILSLCSKNNEEDVWEVFREHPDMVLRMDDIATAQINWGDKATNLRRIAEDLNIGLDSLVFADDSEFEINLVRHVLPLVECIHLPLNRAAEYREILARSGLFESVMYSDEDKTRTSMYKAEAQRKELFAQLRDLNEYYRSLEMVLTVSMCTDFTVPRVAQLTQRTNQFNLTTKRYSEDDIEQMVNSQTYDVLHVRLRDRFGESGIIGVCILEYVSERAVIDTFLISCRALGRGVEDVLLSQALKLGRNRGKELVVGRYVATSKNGQVKDFYQERGFQVTEQDEGRETAIFDLKRIIPASLSFTGEIISEVDTTAELCVQ